MALTFILSCAWLILLGPIVFLYGSNRLHRFPNCFGLCSKQIELYIAHCLHFHSSPSSTCMITLVCYMGNHSEHNFCSDTLLPKSTSTNALISCGCYCLGSNDHCISVSGPKVSYLAILTSKLTLLAAFLGFLLRDCSRGFLNTRLCRASEHCPRLVPHASYPRRLSLAVGQW